MISCGAVIFGVKRKGHQELHVDAFGGQLFEKLKLRRKIVRSEAEVAQVEITHELGVRSFMNKPRMGSALPHATYIDGLYRSRCFASLFCLLPEGGAGESLSVGHKNPNIGSQTNGIRPRGCRWELHVVSAS
jgi:hypothetical protein